MGILTPSEPQAGRPCHGEAQAGRPCHGEAQAGRPCHRYDWDLSGSSWRLSGVEEDD
ncbi:hypothetical protein [Microcoleus sp. K1-B6]|uniref:hypothetical protein n=1 Tax=Microcoleus sp. K1-B6 TaxID=2818787 RepID=UPI002FD84819